MDNRMINIGFGNAVVAGRVLTIVNPKSSPIKKLKDEAKAQKKLIDVTEGRKTRSIIILDSNHVILSAVQPETITQRFSPATAGGILEDD
jgi:extracellular matrix regulatory protein A